MREHQRTMRQAVRHVLQSTTISAAAMALLACASLERTGGTDPTGMKAVEAPTVSGSEVDLPMCNAPDNRAPGSEEEIACTAADNSQNTIAIKVATKDDPEREVESGQTFLCQCGDAMLETPPEGAIAGTLDEFEAIGIVSLNPTCLVWSTVGGLHCVVSVPD